LHQHIKCLKQLHAPVSLWSVKFKRSGCKLCRRPRCLMTNSSGDNDNWYISFCSPTLLSECTPAQLHKNVN